MNKLHPGARWLFRLNAYSQFIILLLILFYIFIRRIFLPTQSINNIEATLIALFFFIIFFIFIGEIYARMSYKRWLYDFTDLGLKIEHGIIWKNYKSIPYEKIQNIEIKRGVIARIFGFSTVDIETAGYSGNQLTFKDALLRKNRRKYKSEGHLPAISVQHSKEIRKFLIDKISEKHQDKQGL